MKRRSESSSSPSSALSSKPDIRYRSWLGKSAVRRCTSVVKDEPSDVRVKLKKGTGGGGAGAGCGKGVVSIRRGVKGEIRCLEGGLKDIVGVVDRRSDVDREALLILVIGDVFDGECEKYPSSSVSEPPSDDDDDGVMGVG